MEKQERDSPEEEEKPEQTYVTVTSIANRLGRTRSMVRSAIERGELPGVQVPSGYNSSGFEWNVRSEDAEAYILHRLANAHIRARSSRKTPALSTETPALAPDLALKDENLPEAGANENLPIGNPNLCGSCGRTTGNILGDVDDVTHRQYGYLCFKCYKLVQVSRGDSHRLSKVLAYLEKVQEQEDPPR